MNHYPILVKFFDLKNTFASTITSKLHVEPGAEEVVDMRGGWADPDLVSGLVW